MENDAPTNAVLMAKIDSVHENVNKIFTLLDAHNGRLTKVERTWNMLVGATLFSSVIIVPIILTIINKYIASR